MRTAFRIQNHVMILDHKAELFGDFLLPFFDFRIIEFFHVAAIDADALSSGGGTSAPVTRHLPNTR